MGIVGWIGLIEGIVLMGREREEREERGWLIE